jgi:hypothetical protein
MVVDPRQLEPLRQRVHIESRFPTDPPLIALAKRNA